MVALRGCPLCTGAAGGLRVRVDYVKIMSEFTDRGMFGPDIRDLASEAEHLARMYSPKRTGKMRDWHYRNIQPARGYTRDFFIGNRAGYAKFVADGTKQNGAGYIMAKPPKLMELRARPYSRFAPSDPRRFRAVVHGQKGQGNWIRQAVGDAIKFRMQSAIKAARGRMG